MEEFVQLVTFQKETLQSYWTCTRLADINALEAQS